MTGPLHQCSASELAHRLQRREISAEAVVQDCLARIDAREETVRAWACLAREAALRTARELDAGPVRGPLHGLPVGVKDLFDTYDLPTSYGTEIYANHRPAADAAVVALAREAGAIVLGKTVSTELANFHPGKTRNPHNPAHTPGGSSSGSAAAVADHMVPLALGTQTAASIVRPAGYCGVVGYKPGQSVLPRGGVKLLSDSLDSVGAFARSVGDVALFVAALGGDGRLRDLDFHGVPRFGLCRTFEWDAADADVAATMDRVAQVVREAGQSPNAVALPPRFGGLVEVQKRIMGYEMARNLAFERIHHGARLSAVLSGVLADGMKLTPWDYEEARQEVFAARAEVPQAFDGCDVLIAPSTTGAAPAGLDFTGDPLFGRVWTLLGLPCVQLPVLKNAAGLPVGLQVVGRPGAERETLIAAHWLEQRLA